jgi:hypothetical protein
LRETDKRKKKKKKKGPQCYKCKEWGHVRRDCADLKWKDVENVVASRKDDSESDSDVLILSSEKSCN